VAVAIVQTKVQTTSTAATTNQLQFDSNVTVGNWVVIIWRQGSGNRSPGIPVPSAGTWSGVQDFLTTNAATESRIYCWSAQQTGSATNTYTTTIASSLTSTGVMIGYELSGVDTGGTPRGSGATQNLTTTTSWNLIASPGATLPSGGILIGAAGTTVLSVSWGTLTSPSGFTTRQNVNSGTGFSHWVGDNLTAGSNITGAASNTTSRAIVTGYKIYLEAAAGGGSAAKNLLLLGVGA
jgi:hypothetical protein